MYDEKMMEKVKTLMDKKYQVCADGFIRDKKHDIIYVKDIEATLQNDVFGVSGVLERHSITSALLEWCYENELDFERGMTSKFKYNNYTGSLTGTTALDRVLVCTETGASWVAM